MVVLPRGAEVDPPLRRESPALETLDVAHRPSRVSRQVRNGRGRLPLRDPAMPGVPVNAEAAADRRRVEDLAIARARYLVARRYLRLTRFRLQRAVARAHADTSVDDR